MKYEIYRIKDWKKGLILLMGLFWACSFTEIYAQEESRPSIPAKLTIFSQNGGKTLGRVFVATGFNASVGSGNSLGNPYKFMGSRFFEIGGGLSTALSQTGFVRLNYGLAFQFNGLKPKDNQLFVRQDEETFLQISSQHLKKYKLRVDNLVVPIQVEFGPADVDYQPVDWHIGMGAYAGTRLGTRQTIKYR